MQKIKYPVGSIIGTSSGFQLKILDLSKNEYVCLAIGEEENIAHFSTWMTQKQLDEQGYKLVSTPRWIPEIGEEFYYVSYGGANEKSIWENHHFQKYMLKDNNVFKTHEECQKKIDEINSREI